MAQELPVNAQLSLQQQDLSSFKNGVYTDKVRTTRLTSANLLSFLAEAYSTNFPTGFPLGAKLVLVDYDHFQVQAGNGSILLTNVSDFLTYSDTYSATNYLYQGKENTLNEAQNYVYFLRATIQFDNHAATDAISFTFTGNMQEKFSQSATDQFGRRMYQDSFFLTGTGEGRAGDSFFLLSGKISTATVKWIN